MSENNKGWIGVDLDGTWAYVDPDHNSKWDINTIGEPIQETTDRVIRAIQEGYEVKVFTARVGTGRGLSPISGLVDTPEFAEHQRKLIQDWTEKVIGVRLPVTAQKDWAMIELWDDRARQVVTNTGKFVVDFWKEVFRDIYQAMGGVQL